MGCVSVSDVVTFSEYTVMLWTVGAIDTSQKEAILKRLEAIALAKLQEHERIINEIDPLGQEGTF